MLANANSVNIESAKRPYHHGDLRVALIETGMRLIENSNAEQLSLREVARAIGVSAAAVYRHFPDKAALLAALAHEGLDRLGTAQMAAKAAAGGGSAGFAAAGCAYVRFALAHPALFRLTMSYTPFLDHFALPHGAASKPMQVLRESVASLAPAGTDPAKLRAAAIRAWSQVHGLAMLMLDGQILSDDALIDAVVSDTQKWPEIDLLPVNTKVQ
jgi:AcrR family transcriptional regulator